MVSKVKNALQLIGSITGRSEKTVHEWRYLFFNSEGKFLDSQVSPGGGVIAK